MSLDIESKLRAFLASAPQSVWAIPTLEISHSAMTQVFHLWREPYSGVTSSGTMQPCNFEVKLAGTGGHLDQVFDIHLDLVDIEDVFREEMDRIPVNTTEKVAITYREYMSDDLTLVQSTAVLQVESVSYAVGSATISAVSPRLNITRTGEVYSMKDIPMLRGF